MQEEKKALLLQQVEKIQEVLTVLGRDFSEDTEDEINFLNIVCGNLKELMK